MGVTIGGGIVGWTRWTELANRDYHYAGDITYDGAAVYELGVRGRYRKYVTTVYVGETGDLKSRMTSYAVNGSHLGKYAKKYWKMGYKMFFRYQRVTTKIQAGKLQDQLLQRFGLEKYPWNNNFKADF